MVCACIDIGSNTTRLLVAEPDGGRIRELLRQRAFTRIGKGLASEDAIPQRKIAEVVDVVGTQVRVARELGSETIRLVATAAIRDAANQEELTRRDRGPNWASTWTSSPTRRRHASRSSGRHALSTTLRTGTSPSSTSAARRPRSRSARQPAACARAPHSESAREHSLTAYLRSDPPTIHELSQIRAHVAGTFEGFVLPETELAVAVGGSATSLRRLVGNLLDHESLERGLRMLARTPSEELARAAEIEVERARLLPAGLLILEEISDRLGRPLGVGRGGLREGVIVDMLITAGWGVT